MSEHPARPRRRLADRLRALLYTALSCVHRLDGEQLHLQVDDGEYRAALTVEPLAAPAGAAEHAPLPVPLPYSAEELADMLAIGPRGAMLVKNIAARRGVRPDDPRLRERLRGLQDRKALGHCEGGYFWLTTNPQLLADTDEGSA